MTETQDHAKALTALETNDPPIEPSQTWSISDEDGTCIKQLRILACHPDLTKQTWGSSGDEMQRKWIYMPTTKGRMREQELGVIPEYNLRRLFELDEDN